MDAPVHALRYPFAIDRGAGRAAETPAYEAYARQLIRQVLFTAPGERINRPDFGAGVRRLVFAPNSSAVASLAQTFIYQALSRWLPSVIRVEQVVVSAAESSLLIEVRYLLIQRGEVRVLNEEVAF